MTGMQSYWRGSYDMFLPSPVLPKYLENIQTNVWILCLLLGSNEYSLAGDLLGCIVKLKRKVMKRSHHLNLIIE